MKAVISHLIVLIFIFKIVNEVDCGCALYLNKDFGSPFPVLLQDGVYLAPNTRDGTVSVRGSGAVVAACPGDRSRVVVGNFTTDLDHVEAICVNNTTFRVGKRTVQFRELRCTEVPWFEVEETRERCHGNHNIVSVGYRIRGTLRPLYEVCFDKERLHSLYSRHQLTPASHFSQTVGGHRPNFQSLGLFDKVRVSEMYKKTYQKRRLNEILGDDMDKEYISKNQFLTRGHLSARADFSTYFAQRASFHYVNVAPQWLRGNAGDWAALEEALRRRVKTYGSNVTIYTGSYGVVTLRDKNGQEKEIYLSVDENNNNVLPVPLYFYKVVYDPLRKAAVAFVSINSPYYDSTERESLTFCEDICDGNTKYRWLKWRPRDDTTSFCCAYADFREKINDLPDLDVEELFY